MEHKSKLTCDRAATQPPVTDTEREAGRRGREERQGGEGGGDEGQDGEQDGGQTGGQRKLQT